MKKRKIVPKPATTKNRRHNQKKKNLIIPSRKCFQLSITYQGKGSQKKTMNLYKVLQGKIVS